MLLRRHVGRLDRHTEEALGEREQPVQNLGKREVRSQLLVGVGIALLSKTLRPEGNVPRGERVRFGRTLFPRESREVREVTLGRGERSGAELLEHPLHRRNVRSHLAVETQRREVLESQQDGLVVAQLQDLPDERRVVGRLTTRPGNARAVDLLAQIPPPAVLDKRTETREVERDPPGTRLRRRALFPGFNGCLRGKLQKTRRKPVDFLWRTQGQRERLGRVEDIVRELRRRLRHRALDLIEHVALVVLETDAGVPRVAQHGLYNPLPSRVECIEAGPLAEAE